MDRAVASLSGWRLRLAIAEALVTEPDTTSPANHLNVWTGSSELEGLLSWSRPQPLFFIK